MAHHHDSHQNGGTGSSFMALVLILALIGVVAVIVLNTGRRAPAPERTVATLVGRNLNWTPSPTVTATSTATFTPTSTPTNTRTPRPSSTPTVTPTFTATLSSGEASAQSVLIGERHFQSVCSACHGYNAQGVAGLGPSFIGNEFVNTRSDADLLAFLHVGRLATDPENSSGISMPARGGSNLSDADLMNVIRYLRSLNPGVTVAGVDVGPSTVEQPVVEDTEPIEPIEFTPLSLSGLVERPPSTAPVETGPYGTGAEQIYQFSCAGCHASDGSGVTAAPLNESALLAARSGIAIFDLFTQAAAGTGFVHPYRGGFPELTDQQILDVIGYLYELTGE